jgi:N-acetylglucosamine-6-phosphate deacetylase
MVEEWVKAGTEVVKLVTLAPEVVSVNLIHTLVAVGIVVSAGHTEASFETAMAGFEAGISMVTHLFNAMSPWLGRTPGVVGAALSRAEIYTGVIVDGHHVHYGSVQLAQRLKQDKLFLVTDATPAAGAEVESFMIGGQEVFYKDGKCVSAAGTLGGSALTMIEAVQNCVKHVGISLAEALRMATLYPARAINVDQQLGQLAPSYQANVVLFDPQSFTVQGVIEQGQLQWIGSKG